LRDEQEDRRGWHDRGSAFGSMPRRNGSIGHISFACHGVVRQVDLRGPMAVRRGSRWLVPLVDLWVASGLPGNLLDLTFEMITSDAIGGAIRTNTFDPQRFARGFVALCDGRLWWDDPAEVALNGRVARAIFVRQLLDPAAE
jgi:hypothetical protein